MLNRPYRLLILLGVVLFAIVAARAQSTTAVTLDPIVPVSGPSGTSFTFTAHVSSGGTPLTAGTVTFSDTYNGITQTLGSVQVQNNNGTAGTAVLHQQVGGLGAHTIFSTFIAITGHSAGTSPPQTITVKPFYSTATFFSSAATPGNYTGLLSAFGSPLPGGQINFIDTSNNNAILSSVPLDPTATSSQFAPLLFAHVDYVYQSGATIGDFNGDGILDFALPVQQPPSASSPTVQIFLGKGDGTFTQASDIGVPFTPISLATEDFNGDGILDLIVLSSDPNTPVSIYFGAGDGTFPSGGGNPIPAIPGAQALAVGDFNNDGFPDVAVTVQNGVGQPGSVLIFTNQGDALFNPPATNILAPNSAPFNIAVGDLNEDGNQDLIVSNENGSVLTLLGAGDGTFGTSVLVPLPSGAIQSGSVAVGHFHGNHLDIAATDQPNNSIYVIPGNGDGTFGSAVSYPTPHSPYFLTVGDFDQDGHPDIVSANFDGTVSVLHNDQGNFASTTPLNLQVTDGQATFAIVGDLNGDNQVDIAAIVTNANPTNIYPYGIGDGLSVLLAGKTTPFSAGPLSIPACQSASASSHLITAMYSGDANYSPSTASPSISLMTTPIVPVTTSLALTLIPAAPTYGQQVQLVAVLNPSSAGSSSTNGALIKFMDGSTTLGTAPLQNGTATLTVAPLAVGSHSLTASYAGDGCAFMPSTSNIVATTIAQPPATAIVTVSAPLTAVVGQNVTLTATVQSSNTTKPTGTITFQSNGAPVGTGTLTNGTATLNTTTLPVGIDSITAIYSGDSIFAGATSTNAASITITAATTPPPPPGLDFTLQVTSPTTINSNYGGSPNYTLLLTPTSAAGFPGVVQFSATTNSLLNATFTFSPATLAANAGPTNVMLSGTTYFSVQNREEGASPFHRLAPMSLCLLVPLCMLRRLRRQRHLLARAMTIVLLTVLGFVGASSLSGCGSGYAPFDYPITVTATSGNVSHSVTVTFHVGAVK